MTLPYPDSPESSLKQLLSRLASGEITVAEAIDTIKLGDAQHAIPGATVDLGRASRCGFGEVIFGEGKSADLLTRIIRVQLDAGQSVLVTRVDAETAKLVQQAFSHSLHQPVARTLRIAPHPISKSVPLTEPDTQTTIHAAVVTAGSTDANVAAEAFETLTWMGIPYQSFEDIGVAGPQRLRAAIPSLRLAAAVVVVAGMEGALPAVVAGYLSSPVFAVPTSVGYGTSLDGLTPLLGMLSSCAPSVAVVNIDAGFKGGYMAGLIVHGLRQVQTKNQNS